MRFNLRNLWTKLLFSNAMIFYWFQVSTKYNMTNTETLKKVNNQSEPNIEIPCPYTECITIKWFKSSIIVQQFKNVFSLIKNENFCIDFIKIILLLWRNVISNLLEWACVYSLRLITNICLLNQIKYKR